MQRNKTKDLIYIFGNKTTSGAGVNSSSRLGTTSLVMVMVMGDNDRYFYATGRNHAACLCHGKKKKKNLSRIQ